MCGVLLKKLGLWSYMLYKVLFEHVLNAKEKIFNNFENRTYSPFLSFILDALQMFYEDLVACGIVWKPGESWIETLSFMKEFIIIKKEVEHKLSRLYT